MSERTSLCECGHPVGWHLRNEGSCIECACPTYLDETSNEAAERAWSYEIAMRKEHSLDA